jgi:hypothetical protein
MRALLLILILVSLTGCSVEYHSPVEAEILKKLPSADAGIGCLIEDMELRKAQFEYARRYNEYVLRHLPKR